MIISNLYCACNRSNDLEQLRILSLFLSIFINDSTGPVEVPYGWILVAETFLNAQKVIYRDAFIFFYHYFTRKRNECIHKYTKYIHMSNCITKSLPYAWCFIIQQVLYDTMICSQNVIIHRKRIERFKDDNIMKMAWSIWLFRHWYTSFTTPTILYYQS